MSNQKFILALEGHGKMFKMFLRNLGISELPNTHEQNAKCNLNFVYDETVSQILMIYEGDYQTFLRRLTEIPDVRFFRHMPEFNNPQLVQTFSNGAKEFALNILFQMHRVLGNRSDVDYLLEAITDDYMIVCQLKKEIN